MGRLSATAATGSRDEATVVLDVTGMLGYTAGYGTAR
jgi:hypothetical protein